MCLFNSLQGLLQLSRRSTFRRSAPRDMLGHKAAGPDGALARAGDVINSSLVELHPPAGTVQAEAAKERVAVLQDIPQTPC